MTWVPWAVSSFRVSRRMAWAGSRLAANRIRLANSQAASREARPLSSRVGGRARSMPRWQARRNTVGAQLGSHAALDAHPPANLHNLVRPELGEAEPPQGLHVDKDVGSA